MQNKPVHQKTKDKNRLLAEYKYLFKSFGEGVPRFLKYQIVTKLLFSLMIVPMFWGLAQLLIKSTGTGALSNSEIPIFLMTPQGIFLMLVGLLLLLCSIIIEICGFITISAGIIHKKPESSYLNLLKTNFKNLPRMLEFGSLLLVLYLAVIIPLSGTGVTLSILKNIRIPNFITSVIESNPLYLTLYTLLLLVMMVLSTLRLFTFHFMTLGEEQSSSGLRHSMVLVRKNLKEFLKKFVGVALLNALIATTVMVLWVVFIIFLGDSLDTQFTSNKIIILTLLLIQNIVIGFFAMMFIPFEVHHLTLIFYDLTAKTPPFESLPKVSPSLPPKAKRSFMDRLLARKKTLVFLVVVSAILAAVPMGIFFKELFLYQNRIQVVGHRGGGGYHIPENSLASIRESIKNSADYVEIDVQRTLDGAYIINHDPTFNRLTGDKRTPQEMTLSQIKELDIGAKYPGYEREKVPTLEEVLELCKGQIGIFIELKGVSADEKMVEDVIKMAEKHHMQSQILIMSLDYNLIQYVREQHPRIDTGFVYFLSVGNPGSFDSSYIILEEDAATDKNLMRINDAGKKPIVWTVNKQESMDKFSKKEIQGVITDDVKAMVDTLDIANSLTEKDVLMELFFNQSN